MLRIKRATMQITISVEMEGSIEKIANQSGNISLLIKRFGKFVPPLASQQVLCS